MEGETMSHTTQLRGGWIAISDGTLDDESIVKFKRIDQNGKCTNWFSLEYYVIKDFFAEQIGYDLESLFEDVDAAGIIDGLIRANRKPKIKNFWERTPVVEDEVPSLAEKRTNPWPIKTTVHFTTLDQYNEFMKWVGDEKKHFVIIEKDI
jgi:hypothetical protein